MTAILWKGELDIVMFGAGLFVKYSFIFPVCTYSRHYEHTYQDRLQTLFSTRDSKLLGVLSSLSYLQDKWRQTLWRALSRSVARGMEWLRACTRLSRGPRLPWQTLRLFTCNCCKLAAHYRLPFRDGNEVVHRCSHA